MTISIDVFLIGLMIVSTLTGLVTEAIKKMLAEYNKNCYSNTLAAIVATGLSVAVGVGYVLMMNIGFTTGNIVCIIALTFMSWLCSMVGYDKVVGVIKQFKNK